ncbi:MAG: DEAD/DEAH box helicase [Verrucomicrobiia bacterium]
MSELAEQLDRALKLNRVIIPDLWQQQAVVALREGKDVVVHAPTGAGKTLIFELWTNYGATHKKAIYTVPTRALANDKLAEWRARGWKVGIATGDLSDNLDAPIIVATLETQKNRMIQGDGPDLLVVDEYQMIADPDRGLNYELAIAMAPLKTRLLLLSGSVANPQDVVKWLRRIGRDAVLIRHDIRPVPLEEVNMAPLIGRVPRDIRGFWARFVAAALSENLGPILIFAPRRQGAETIASEIARNLPCPNPLTLTDKQRQLIDDKLERLLVSRVAYHHSGLSYGARAGVIEPLAKAGQLRVVVATMGLAAGINFSLRSVALAGESYKRDNVEVIITADEILQMFGRAGRRGIDETGYVLIGPNEISLRDAYPAYLSRSGLVDWNALLNVMHSAAQQGINPFEQAVKIQEKLFTSKPVHLGVEESLVHPDVPCGLKTDSERARHVRKPFKQILNSKGEWEPLKSFEQRPLKGIYIAEFIKDSKNPEEQNGSNQKTFISLRSILTEPNVLKGIGPGDLCQIGKDKTGNVIYGKTFTIAEVDREGAIYLVKWIRRMSGFQGRQIQRKFWNSTVLPVLRKKFEQQRLVLIDVVKRDYKILGIVSLEEQMLKVPVDSHGVALWNPVQRNVISPDCARCNLVETCRKLSPSTATVLLWKRLGLIDANGVPTVRGRIASFFSQGDGLAIAAAIEDESYPLEELVYDLANLEGSFRFSGDENRWSGRLAYVCQKLYGNQNIEGYLDNGVPIDYGAGASEIVAIIHKNPSLKMEFTNEIIGIGDIDRLIIEWRSLLRQIAHSPPLDCERWTKLQQLAKAILNETQSPTIIDLPPLAYNQTKRVDHRLIFKKRY